MSIKGIAVLVLSTAVAIFIINKIEPLRKLVYGA